VKFGPIPLSGNATYQDLSSLSNNWAMKFEFQNVHFDGVVQTKADALVRIVGDFSLWVRDRLVYKEAEFCLFEFALALANWLAVVTDSGPDFVYTSLESETEGLLRFGLVNRGQWRVSSAYEELHADDLVTTTELRNASLDYIREFTQHLGPKWDVTKYVEDGKRRETLRAALASSG
jgi:hypothetical protein